MDPIWTICGNCPEAENSSCGRQSEGGSTGESQPLKRQKQKNVYQIMNPFMLKALTYPATKT